MDCTNTSHTESPLVAIETGATRVSTQLPRIAQCAVNHLAWMKCPAALHRPILPLAIFVAFILWRGVTGELLGLELRQNNPAFRLAQNDLSLSTLDGLAEPTTAETSTASALSLGGLGGASSEGSVGGRQLELSAHQQWTDNLRQTVDLSSRPIYHGRLGVFSHATFLGVDLHKVFTGPDGDWGTLTLQPYLTRLDNFPSFPPFFDDGDDFEVVYRICNFNYTAYGRGKTNFRIGHMEIPYGLEQIINTNGTLRDYTHVRNIGVKADWGVSFNGETSDVEYEFALMRGSGNEWRRRSSPFLLAGRIGTARGQPVTLGLSALHGEIFRYSADTIRRTRLGLDVTVGTESFVWLGEVSAGFDGDTNVFNALIECDFHSKTETVLIYDQLVSFGSDARGQWDADVINFLGIRYQPDNHWAFSAQWSQSLHGVGDSPSATVIALQTRYRF